MYVMRSLQGISSIAQYVTGRRLNVLKSDVISLLTQENPFFSELSPVTQAEMIKMDLGGMIMVYNHTDRLVLSF